MTAAQQEAGLVHYVLDKAISRFTVRVSAGGLLSAMGHNPVIAIRDFMGEARFDPRNPGQGSLHIQIRADSLEVTDDIRSTDRKEIESMMNHDILQTSNFPTIVFESADSSAAQIAEGRFRIAMNSNLSLHGRTRVIPIGAQVILTGDMLRTFADFSILQSNFGIPPISVAGGPLILKDELKFSFDIVARTQEDDARKQD